MDIEKLLKRSKYSSKSKELAAAFRKNGCVRPELLDSAPVLVHTTYGFDIYELVEFLKQRLAQEEDKAQAEPVENEEVADGS